MAVSCSSTLLLTPKSHIIYVRTKDLTGHWIQSAQAEHVCCQLLSPSACLPLEAALARKGILSAWSGLNLFCTLVQEGVGDTPDSYAYDGNRVRKWNVTTTNYGKVSTVLPGRQGSRHLLLLPGFLWAL